MTAAGCFFNVPGKRRRLASLLILLALVLLSLVMIQPAPSMADPGKWTPTGSMLEGRECHTATLLANGKVLVVGGFSSTDHHWAYNTCELYDPATETWRPTGSLTTWRGNHTAIMLPSGKVLVQGGFDGFEHDIYTAEMYDPNTETWSSASSLSGGERATTTLLPSGKVLRAGGHWHPIPNTEDFFYGSYIYDPNTDPTLGGWSETGPMNERRSGHTATLLPNGEVLVTGGLRKVGGTAVATNSAELFSPLLNSWRYTASLGDELYNHTATLLRNGRVLVLGRSSARLYEPSMGTWSDAGSLNGDFWGHTATLLPNGNVLLAGKSYYGISSSLYDPTARTWKETGQLGTPRNYHTATLLPNGRVLVTGGRGTDPNNSLNTAELYQPDLPLRTMLPPLLAFYPFEGNARDFSGHDRHGTGYGTAFLVTGFEGQAYYINGSGYFAMPVNINPALHPRLTIGAWVKTLSTGMPQPVITHDNGGYDRSLCIDSRGAGIGWSAFCGNRGVLGAVPAIQGAWTFLAVVYDQINHIVRLQVDDMVLTQQAATLSSGLTQLYIGASPQFNNYFVGVIDNVFVFDGALTDQQLAYIRQGKAQAILSATKRPNPSTLFLMLMK